jgi:hypothetical protein
MPYTFDKTTSAWRQQQRGRNTEDVVSALEERIRTLEERMLIIDPPTAILAKYPALAEAYREYKIVEKLTIGYDQT